MRKSKVVVVDIEGRDKGRAYLVTEMPAMQAEKWAARALLALSKAGMEVPEEAVQAGAAGVLAAGFSAFRTIPFEDAEPLLDDMMRCVQFIPDTTKIDQLSGMPFARPLMDDDVDEVATLFQLRSEVVEIHVGFSLTATLSKLAERAMADTSRTPTSRKPSGKSSAGGSRRTTNAKRSMV